MIRTALLAAALAASFVPGAQAGPGVDAAVTMCVTTTGLPSCTFSCVPNGTVLIQVLGAGNVQGSASCRTDRAHCTGQNNCTDTAGLDSPEGTGICDLTTGQVAICRSV